MPDDNNRYSKDKMLPFLYFIRAIFSQISVWSDDAKKLIGENNNVKDAKVAQLNKEKEASEAGIEEYEKNIANNEEYILYKEKVIKGEELDVKLKEKSVKAYKEQAGGKHLYLHHSLGDWIRNMLDHFLVFALVSGIVGVIICIALWTVPKWEDTSESAFIWLNNLGHIVGGIFFGILLGVVIFAIIVFVMPSIIYLFYLMGASSRKRRQGRNRAAKAQKELPEVTEKANKNISQAEKDIELARKYNKEFEGLILASKKNVSYKISLIDKENKKAEKFADGVNEEVTKLCVALYNEAVKVVDDMLDPRDWENVDYLIYLFETGRADTKKEALNLLDTYEFRNDIANTLCRGIADLKNAINSSARMIRDSFNQQINSLKHTIYMNGMATSQRLDALAKETGNIKTSIHEWSTRMNEQNEQVNSLLHNINENTADIELTNALLKKMNDSTEHMYDEYIARLHRKGIY